MAREMSKRRSESEDPASGDEEGRHVVKRVKLERMDDDERARFANIERARRGTSANSRGRESDEDEDMEDDRDASDSDTDLDDDAANLRAKANAEKKKRNMGYGSVPEAGVIKGIRIVDFMCHKHFSYNSFGPKINFIVGHNGSGKSAILTALAVALGAKASVTGRGQGVKDMVARDADKAIITLILSNKGYDAFEPEKYPDQIVIERWIAKNGSSGYKFRATEDGKIITTKREELSTICAHFNIDIDSPLTLLTQDNAKTFLASTDNRKLYELFFKGTSLQQLADQYTQMDATRRKMDSDLARAREGIPNQRAKVERLQSDIRSAERARELKGEKTECEKKLAWAFVKRKEKDTQKHRDEAELLTTKVQKAQESIDEITAQLGPTEREIGALNDELNELTERRRPTQVALKKAKTELHKSQSKASFNEDEMKAIKEDVNRVRKEIANLEGQIAARQHGPDATQNPRERELQERRKKLEDGLSSLRRRLPEAERKATDAAQELDRAEAEYTALESRRDDIRVQLDRAKQSAATLQRQSTDRMAVYGQGFDKVMARIRQARWHHSEPLGPLGLYVQLEDMRYRDAAHATLGQLLCGFAVRDHRDKHTLLNILKECKQHHGFRSVLGPNSLPTVYQHTNDMFDFSAGDLSRVAPTMLSKLKFTNDAALRIFVNMAHIERLGVAPTQREGYNEMKRVLAETRLPQVTFISADGYTQTGKSNGSTQSGPLGDWKSNPIFVKDVATELANIRERVNTLQPEADAALQRCADHARHRQGLQTVLAKANQTVEHLNKGIPRFRGDIQRLEDEIADLQPANGDFLVTFKTERENELHNIEVQLRILEEAHKEVLQEIRTATKTVEELDEEQQRFGPETDEKRAAILVLAEKQTKAQNDRQFYRNSRARTEKELEATTNLITESEAELETWTTQAQNFCDRIDSDMSVDDLHRRIKALEKSIADAAKQNNINLDDTLAKFTSAKAALKTMEDSTRTFLKLVHILKDGIQMRQEKWQELRQHLSVRVRTAFIEFINKRGFEGRLLFDHDQLSLSILVQTTGLRETQAYSTQAQFKAPINLSGGERSYSTISFLLALWNVAPTTISCLDEWDVFLDSANRSVAANMLIEGAKQSDGKQFVLITPLDMGGVNVSGNHNRVIKLSDPERGQQTLS